MSALGRRVPTSWEHAEKYPLMALTSGERPTGVPVVLGVNWYENFDSPIKLGGLWWIGRGDLGRVRGGHSVCLRPSVPAPSPVDAESWWYYYNQGAEGACVGFACSRMMSLLNRHRYKARWLYLEAQKIDEWEDTPPEEGTSVRAACDVLRSAGHFYERGILPTLGEGIAANRWATNAQEVLDALGRSDDRVPVLNSWGQSYPRTVWMPADTLNRLLFEYGEAVIPVDR